MIPESSRTTLRNAVIRRGGTVQSSEEFEHCGSWDPATQQIFVSHLGAFLLSRRHEPTMPPPRLALHGLIRARRRQEAAEAAKELAKASVVSYAAANATSAGGALAAYAIEGDPLNAAAASYGGAASGPIGAGLGTLAVNRIKRRRQGV